MKNYPAFMLIFGIFAHIRDRLFAGGFAANPIVWGVWGF
jgi:hypothetical protein